MSKLRSILSVVLFVCVASNFQSHAATPGNWNQFMNGASHTGNAADRVLSFPLVLNAQVRLADSILTSPVIVDGLVYVVDQMGTAYCVDPETKSIVWKTNPDGAEAMGSNTSSPCVVNGKMHRSRELPDTPAVRGMLAKIPHLVAVENGDG